MVGRTAAAANVPLFAVLALEGDMSPELRERPWFDIDGRPRISRAIDVVSVTGLGDYLRGRMWASPCRANVASHLDSEFQREVVARFDKRTVRA
ncbi:MAG: hypothetical protein Q8K63_09135, partial [Acidimicrobiales bacterium]|nr:hypothetical protein [Acidimicrobiales bacterium]